MLESSCEGNFLKLIIEVCYCPIMKSKQNEYVCVGCNWSKFILPGDN